MSLHSLQMPEPALYPAQLQALVEVCLVLTNSVGDIFILILILIIIIVPV